MSTTIQVELDKIRTDGGTQSRVRLDDTVIDEYSNKLKAEVVLPPMDVFYDGAEYWLADGFHRYRAHQRLQHKHVPCAVHGGKVRDAIVFACGANHGHGLRRSQEDRRKAVMTLLEDEEWATYSTRRIAEMCNVSHEFVRQLQIAKSNSTAVNIDTSGGETRTHSRGRDGKTYPITPPQSSKLKAANESVHMPTASRNLPYREPGDDTDLIKAERARSRNNGREIISSKDRRAAKSGFGVVVRFLDKLGRADEFSVELGKILQVIEGDLFGG